MTNLLNRFARQALVLLATLVFLWVSTLALAHNHTCSKSGDESHCAMCMAVHSSTHAIETPVIALFFTAVGDPFPVRSKSFLITLPCPALNQDRAPPSLRSIGPLPYVNP